MKTWFPLALLVFAASPIAAQDRDTKVRADRKAFQDSTDWIYNNLADGLKVARNEDKPVMVVFRCIPCEACQKFDDDVARRDPVIRDLLDRFVCVRIVQANTIDLAHFQYDFDLSFAVILMNADMTIYGRFGTRSQRPEFEDISLQGLRAAMEGALRLHANYDAERSRLGGKQARPTRFKAPREFPSLKERFADTLDYEGQVARSCMHCHQIRDAERRVYRTERRVIPDDVLYPYPDPATLGLKLDPEKAAVISKVAPDSPAARAGLQPGDAMLELASQPLLSIADVQWVLQNTAETAVLKARVARDGTERDVEIALPSGWRRGDISWRVTSWELRRMAFGGMRLDPLTTEERNAMNIPGKSMALRIRHVGEFGEHAVAKRAGFRKGDLIVAFDGRTDEADESELLRRMLQEHTPGEAITVAVMRDGQKHMLTFTLP